MSKATSNVHENAKFPGMIIFLLGTEIDSNLFSKKENYFLESHKTIHQQ